MDTSRHEFGEWPVDLLIDYALKVHHRGIRVKGPRLLQLIRLLMDENMVMTEIDELFSQSLANLENHLRKEENVLFPYLYDLLGASRNGEHIEAMHCGTIANPIRVMVMEHEDEKERHQRICDLTNGYSAPADASEDYKLLVAGLKDFAADLQEHTHIENDIIFPYCQRIEEKIVGPCIS